MREINVLVVSFLMLIAILVGATSGWAETSTAGSFERAIDREVSRLLVSSAAPQFSSALQRQPRPQKRNWIQRHPVLFGTLVGFGGGFLIGFLPGDDGVLDDFVASFNGLVIGGVGALTGAVVGEVVSK